MNNKGNSIKNLWDAITAVLRILQYLVYIKMKCLIN